MPVLLYAGLIFYLSSQPLDFIGEGPFPHWDKVAHIIEFGLFCFLILRALRGTFPKAVTLAIAPWALLLTVVYGVLDEFHQLFVPHRSMDLFDVFADGTGAFLVLAFWFLRNRKETR